MQNSMIDIVSVPERHAGLSMPNRAKPAILLTHRSAPGFKKGGEKAKDKARRRDSCAPFHERSATKRCPTPGQGFEPQSAGPEPDVLPLHHPGPHEK